MALPYLFSNGSELLVSLDNYPQISEKSGYDLNSGIDLWWGDFQKFFGRCYYALMERLSGPILFITGFPSFSKTS